MGVFTTTRVYNLELDLTNPFLVGAAVDMYFAISQYYGGTLNSLISTSRASTGYVTNLDGTLTMIGSNTPRIGVGTGLLVEEARTNEIRNSQDLMNITNPWTSDASSNAVGVTGPDNVANSSFKVIENAANAIHQTYQISVAPSIAQKTATVIAKAAERNWIAVFIYDAVNTKYAWFDLSAGAIGTVNAGVTAQIVALANGFYACSITYTTVANATNIAGAQLATADGVNAYAGDGVSGLYVWGLNFETGGFPTSFITTTPIASVTRAADVVTGLFTVGASAGSFFAQETIYGTSNANTGILGVVSTTARPLFMAAGSSPFFVNYTDTVNNAGQTANQATFGTAFKAASSFDGTGASVVLNGGTVATNAFVATLAGNGGLFFGNSLGNGIVGSAYIARVAYYTTRISDAQLQAITK